eukprot:scaffold30004_cov90-Isochrysis_galbana.AAC.1
MRVRSARQRDGRRVQRDPGVGSTRAKGANCIAAARVLATTNTLAAELAHLRSRCQSRPLRAEEHILVVKLYLLFDSHSVGVTTGKAERCRCHGGRAQAACRSSPQPSAEHRPTGRPPHRTAVHH